MMNENLPGAGRRPRAAARLWTHHGLIGGMICGLAGAIAGCGSSQPPAGSAADISRLPAASPREAEVVVLQGRQLPAWSQPAARGSANAYPSGTPASGIRDAHNGTFSYPAQEGFAGLPTAAAVDQIAAFAWDGERFVEIPLQVDERFPYFLANANSSFSVYSGTDTELSYAFDTENWRKTAGTCTAEFADALRAMADPVPGLDDDDELVFMARDAGGAAPAEARPEGTAGPGYTLTLNVPGATDDAADTAAGTVYLFLKPQGAAYASARHYVDYRRNADADDWIDRYFFAEDDPEKLGSSNTDYGPNLAGSVCPDRAKGSERYDYAAAGCEPGSAICASVDRFPRDGVRVRTPGYEWVASGRWMIRELHVADPQGRRYGPDLIDRWKGRAFQQSPDSDVSLVGFEDEQVNWEANAATLGERCGPLRCIREIWGADSGTNVTKTEVFYRDYIQYRYRVRVHPIPPDGLYTSWDYNRDAVERYYTPLRPDGVAIDGVNDDIGNIEQLLALNFYVDVPDPTFNLPLTFLTWSQVAGRGRNGSIVSQWVLNSLSSLVNPLATPYYRDDACFDDGTGDDPVPRPYPGEPSSDPRVQAGYAAAAQARGEGYDPENCAQRSGVYAADGLHLLLIAESDNLFTGAPLTEAAATQWQFVVAQDAPRNVGADWVQIARRPLRVGIEPRE